MQALSGLHNVLCGRNYAVEHIQYYYPHIHTCSIFILDWLISNNTFSYCWLCSMANWLKHFVTISVYLLNIMKQKGETNHIACERHGWHIRRDWIISNMMNMCKHIHIINLHSSLPLQTSWETIWKTHSSSNILQIYHRKHSILFFWNNVRPF